MKQKHLTKPPVCPRERLVIISKPTGLSFAVERIGPLAAIIITAFYLLALYLSAISKPPANLSFSIYSESFIKTACQHLLLLVGFDTLIYRKYYDTPPILVGHHMSMSTNGTKWSIIYSCSMASRAAPIERTSTFLFFSFVCTS
jgi:predicted membrane protein